jgi:hypothetical protein
MMDAPLMAAILDSLKGPLLFADTQHVIRYVNAATLAHYEEGTSLPGCSLLDCHNPQSQREIVEILDACRTGSSSARPRPAATAGRWRCRR